MYNMKEQVKIVNDVFIESVLKNLKMELVRKVITVPVVSGKGFPAYDEYADYRNVNSDNVLEKAKELGSGLATLYNALIQNAVNTKEHKIVTDLFANGNLRFNHVMNNEPSVADPAGVLPGWLSFRFYFKSSNERPESLSTNQDVLSKLEAR